MKLVMRFYNASQAAYSSATKVRGVNVRMALTKCANSMSTNVFCLETIRLNLSVANRIINGHSMSVRSQLSLARRFAHTDVKFPNFENYRRDSTLDINKAARESEDERRAISHAIYYGVGGMMALIAAKESIQGIVAFKGMAADQKALASIEVKMEEIPEGQTKTYEWQGKPVFVRHRTAKEIQCEKEVVISGLRDPQTDEERVQDPEWLVVLGLCSHLGCVPIPGAGDYGGYFCPCHGTHFDGSGRIRRGPAPLNLEVPPYSIKGDTIVIGISE
ncbi:unnamed protein product [Toxocara canis]|uniref:Cytochrome b-c1 complex subunit Rieske, mitochondrial n=1 Tax=Toxocara canis TaxID=6265 RepID=A0A183UUR2_TOXCA|nr:unnamed protein product [Toxocara canis]